MMNELYTLIISIVLSTVLGLLGYFLKSIYTEIKTLLKELIEYTQELRNLINGIQIQIDKGIETDITELKKDVRSLYSKVNIHKIEIHKLQNNNQK